MNLTLTQLATHAARARQKADEPVTLAYYWPQPWNGIDRLEVDGDSLPLRYCASQLEVRAALSDADSATTRVLLVGLNEHELGQDVLGRLFRHRLLHVDRWQLVEQAFGVRSIDPRLFGMEWLPEALLNAAPAKRTTSAVTLSLDEAMTTCLAPVLGTDAGSIDLEALLLACLRSDASWVSLAAEPKAQYRKFLIQKLGNVADALLNTLDAGNGHAALAIGLVCEVLYAREAAKKPKLRDARVRLEQYLNGKRLTETEGQKWAELATRLIHRMQPGGAGGGGSAPARDSGKHSRAGALPQVAQDLLEQIGAADYVGMSSLLPQALDQRLAALGKSVKRFLDSVAELTEVEKAAAWVQAHELPPDNHPGPEHARMVARLCRREHELADADGTIEDYVADFMAHGAWEDWARRWLRGALPTSLSRSVSRLLDRIAERRAEADHHFAERVAASAADSDTPAGVLPIESALSSAVAPLAQHNPVAMIVMDGMSWDVYLALAENMTRRGWTAWRRPQQPEALLAAVPSVTEYSRASLFAGRPMQGAAAQEAKAFAQHKDLKRVSRANKPPLLLHKAGLTDSHQLSDEAVAALGDADQRIVAVVINAIDDTLDSADQVRLDWNLETIPLLAAVLEQARRAGRAVVLTADHGHVLERNSKHHKNGEGERWRRDNAPVKEGEIRIAGPRVEALTGEPVVVPWSEHIRYASKKNGYHGGVARQEMLVPLGIWTIGNPPATGSDANPFVPASPDAPGWWHQARNAGARAAPVQPEPKAAEKTASMDDLFAPAPDAGDSKWLEQLLQSPQLQRQRQRAGRMAVSDGRLRALLTYLDAQGGRAGIEQLAAQIKQPRMRMRGIIAAMERMLNVDGYPIVSVEHSNGTVLLNMDLLKKQFLA